MSRASVEDERDRSGRVCLAFAVHEVERGEEDARGLGYLRRVDEYRADGRRIVEFDAIDGDAVSGGVLACLRQLLAWAGAAATGPALPAFWVFWVFVSLISVAPWMSVQLYAGRAGRPGSWPWFAASSARLFGGVIRLDGTFRLICAVHLIDAVQSCFVQRGVAGVGVLAGHVCLGGDLQYLARLAFRGGDDDLETSLGSTDSARRVYRPSALMSASSRKSVV